MNVLYPPRAQCVYLIRPANERVCEFELDLVQFQLEENSERSKKPPSTSQDYYPSLPRSQCKKDFLQLPDRTRICGRMNFRRIFNFPKYHDRTAMLYFSSDDSIEDRGFDIIIRQLPNSCLNANNNVGVGTSSFNNSSAGLNQNVYVINNPSINDDPNLRFFPPTPVYTYHNQTGLQPRYNPHQQGNKGITTFVNYNVNPPWFKSQQPGVVWNDPRNVDSTGTIPLYYQNGSLATRVPPLKPVDMISILKSKNQNYDPFGTKTSNKILPFGSRLTSAVASERSFNHNNEVQFIPRSINSNPAIAIGTAQPIITTNTIDHHSNQLLQLQPLYSCDQVLSRTVEYIRSPNFPAHYPPVSRCIYTLLKSDNSVCQVQLQLLTFDLEYTPDCRSDYFQIETTGERLCGRIFNSGPKTNNQKLDYPQSTVRIINYYGHSRDLRLIFNSDRQNTASGFEIRIEQLPNSCDGAGGPTNGSGINNNNGSLMSIASISNIVSAKAFSQQELASTSLSNIRNQPSSTISQFITTTTMSTTVNNNEQFLIPQALVTPSRFNGRSNRSAALFQPQSSSLLNNEVVPLTTRICRSTGLTEDYFESDNFPSAYPVNTDCLYKIFRSNRNVCRIEVEFLHFDVGNEITASSSSPTTRNKDDFINENLLLSSSLQQTSSSSLSTTSCPNDYLEIDHVKKTKFILNLLLNLLFIYYY